MYTTKIKSFQVDRERWQAVLNMKAAIRTFSLIISPWVPVVESNQNGAWNVTVLAPQCLETSQQKFIKLFKLQRKVNPTSYFDNIYYSLCDDGNECKLSYYHC